MTQTQMRDFVTDHRFKLNPLQAVPKGTADENRGT